MIDVICLLIVAVALTLLLATYPLAVVWLMAVVFVVAPFVLRWLRNQR